MTTPPACRTAFVDLPLCRLHVMTAGDGPPLIMVPATISLLKEWIPLVQFMAQWFTVTFFELPGHGESQAFPNSFATPLVAELVEQLVDAMGYERFSLMGFSFGGMLAMRTYLRLNRRIDRLCLMAPCLTNRAMPLSRSRQKFIRDLNRFVSRPRVRRGLLAMFHNPRLVGPAVHLLRSLGKVEQTIPLDEKLSVVRETTLEVLNAQIEEILTVEFAPPEKPFSTPCYFAMSLYDPLLDFDTTLAVAGCYFASMKVIRLSYPYHQPPTPFTFEELNRDYYATVNEFVGLTGER